MKQFEQKELALKGNKEDVPAQTEGHKDYVPGVPDSPELWAGGHQKQVLGRAANIAKAAPGTASTRKPDLFVRPFPEQLMYLLASRAARFALWWIPQSCGKAFAIKDKWFTHDVMQKHFPGQAAGITLCLRKWYDLFVSTVIHLFIHCASYFFTMSHFFSRFFVHLQCHLLF